MALTTFLRSEPSFGREFSAVLIPKNPDKTSKLLHTLMYAFLKAWTWNDMVGDDATRFSLKTELLQRVEALGLQQALFSSEGGEPINEIVQQLESINPIPQPLHPNHLSSLLGNWQLVYASKGTVVISTS